MALRVADWRMEEDIDECFRSKLFFLLRFVFPVELVFCEYDFKTCNPANTIENALKYTETGFVRVSLQAGLVPAISETSQSLLQVVSLEVEDSGIGMSRDFLKHRMYTPFAQVSKVVLEEEL